MAIVNCLECGREVSTKAKSCPNCGAEIKKKSGCLKFLWIIIFVIIGIFVIGAIFSENDDTQTSQDYSNNEILAYNYAKDFVKEKLKSPSSAIFPSTREKVEHVINLGGGEYKINSWVESQNSFGAMIKTDFSCRIIFIDGSVKVKDLKVE